MVSKGRHQKNPINRALDALDPNRFAIEPIHVGHRWGVVRCLTCDDTVSVWSTPRVPENNAADIQRFAKRHQH
jgi:hypothetical protein